MRNQANLKLLILLIIPALVIGPFSLVRAQSTDQKPKPPVISTFNAGIGFGLDYGGIGGAVMYTPMPKLGLFAALGYNLVGLGYNVGASYRILPARQFCPLVCVMYGYNAVISVSKKDSPYNKTYYGPSVGGGVEWHLKSTPQNFIKFELIYPFRSDAYYDDLDKLRHDPGYEIKSVPPDMAFSLGYHFGL